MEEDDHCRTKIAECQRRLDSCDDLLTRQVYRAMLSEFTDKLAAERLSANAVHRLLDRGQGRRFA
jgi:hypothetical protein